MANGTIFPKPPLLGPIIPSALSTPAYLTLSVLFSGPQSWNNTILLAIPASQAVDEIEGTRIAPALSLIFVAVCCRMITAAFFSADIFESVDIRC